MKLQKIELEGFKSFAEYTEFSFELDDGLYFVTGENQSEPELGANGAGKSALFEAICWCLYGKTSTNLKAGNVVNWENKGCRVRLDFDDGHNIFRQQAPNLLQISQQNVSQEELEKHLGYLGFESFLYSTFISQFSSKFFDLSPADKLFVFSDIMAETLHPWEIRSNQAKTKAVQLEVTIKGMENTISNLQGKVEQLLETSYSKQIKEFEDNKKKAISNYKEDIKDLSNKKVTMKESLHDLMKNKAKVQVAQKQFKPVTSTREFNDIKTQYNNSYESEMAARSNYKHTEREMKEMEGTAKQVSICPTCKQPVDKKLLLKKIDECKKVMAVSERDSYFFKDKKEKHAEKLRELEDKISQENKANAELLTQLRVLQTTIDSLTARMSELDIETSNKNSNLKVLEESKNNFKELEEERQDNIKKFKSALKDNEDLLNVAHKEFDAYNYWVKGFKEIRLLLMLDALKEFEVSINNNLSKFGLSDWSVQLDIDRETKSGTVRKGFVVLVESPNHNGFVPFEVWSGGEGQRLRLAGTVGLMDLIQSKRQVDFGLEIFDEPTAWLSDKGIDDLCQTLYYRAKENEKKIFLIDHKNLGSYGMFTGTINIVKDENGSHIYS